MISPRTAIPPARCFSAFGADAVLNAFASLRAAARRDPFLDEQTFQRLPLHLRELSSSVWAHRALRRREAAVRARLSAGECAARALGELTETLGFVERVASLRGSRLQAWVAERGRRRHASLSDRLLGGLDGASREEAAAEGRLPPSALIAAGAKGREAAALQEELAVAEKALMQGMQKLAKGSAVLDFSEDDLVGLTGAMSDEWRRRGSAGRFRVPVNRSAFDKVMSFAHRRATRARVFDAYFGMFGPEDDGAALRVLRLRQKLARTMRFACWADFELASLTVGKVGACDLFLTTCYQQWQPVVTDMVQRMRSRTEHVDHVYSPGRSGPLDQIDELYAIASERGEVHDWTLSEALAAETAMQRALALVGDLFQVRFAPVPLGPVASGWSSKVRAYSVRSPSGHLGYLYLDPYERWYHTLLGGRVEQAKAIPVSPGHVFLALNLEGGGPGGRQGMAYAEVACFVHELGHAVHHLQSPHSPAEYAHMPLDVQETPAVLAEMVAYDPLAVSRIAGGVAPNQLKSTTGHRDIFFFVHLLQNVAVLHALHSEAFDAESSSIADFRAVLKRETQRFSPFRVVDSFHPFGRMTGIHLAQSMNQIAYLFAYGQAEACLAEARGKAPRLFPPRSARFGQEVLSQRFPPHVLDVAAAGRAGRDSPLHPFARQAGRWPTEILNGTKRRAAALR